MDRFIKDNLDVIIKVKRCRVSGNVIIACSENNEMKKSVMANKSRLKGKKIFLPRSTLSVLAREEDSRENK